MLLSMKSTMTFKVSHSTTSQRPVKGPVEDPQLHFHYLIVQAVYFCSQYHIQQDVVNAKEQETCGKVVTHQRRAEIQ